MKNKVLKIIGGVVAVCLLFSCLFFIRATRPIYQARKEAIVLAEKYAGLEDVDKFYWFSRKETYFSLLGTDKNKEKIAVFIPKTGKKISVLSQSDGVSEATVRKTIEAEYKPKKIMKVTLGMYEKEPVWEVTTKNKSGYLNYYLIDYTDGQVTKIIENV